ncbi:hypothetical protein SAMN04488082_10884 [Desulfomicrobium apsheronum]|uniref:Uncharacterized protein n=1 Tax=Desulfomicrobium apsheronum TaxID=52560 RepID=A0A1I3UQS7_9BACT|nr:hypothetical protein [Desulfomicrobium apsheronum]SFJ85350.1 hypothetical protein SAMN04488082_10884 [Desulfomicrobium apsheronum]
MNVQGAGNQQAWMTVNHVERKNNATEKPVKTAEMELTPPPATGDGQESKGVIRLLQAGHFQGVADVRLRINFHDELQQVAAQNAANDFEGASTELFGDLAARLGVLGEEHGLSGQAEELAGAFSADIEQLLEEAKAEQTPLSTTLSDINSRFSELLESLQGAFAGLAAAAVPQEQEGTEPELAELLENEGELASEEQLPGQVAADMEEAPTEETGEEIAETENPGLTAFKAEMQELEAWFTQSLTALHGDVTAAAELPPLSEPRGNGAAYAKFLEIYRNMNTGAESTGAQSETPLDELNAEV